MNGFAPGLSFIANSSPRFPKPLNTFGKCWMRSAFVCTVSIDVASCKAVIAGRPNKIGFETINNYIRLLIRLPTSFPLKYPNTFEVVWKVSCLGCEVWLPQVLVGVFIDNNDLSSCARLECSFTPTLVNTCKPGLFRYFWRPIFQEGYVGGTGADGELAHGERSLRTTNCAVMTFLAAFVADNVLGWAMFARMRLLPAPCAGFRCAACRRAGVSWSTSVSSTFAGSLSSRVLGRS